MRLRLFQRKQKKNQPKEAEVEKETSIWDSKEAKRKVRMEKGFFEMLHPSQRALGQGCFRAFSILGAAALSFGVILMISIYWISGSGQAAVNVPSPTFTIDLGDLVIASPTLNPTSTPTSYATRERGILTPTSTPTPTETPEPSETPNAAAATATAEADENGPPSLQREPTETPTPRWAVNQGELPTLKRTTTPQASDSEAAPN